MSDIRNSPSNLLQRQPLISENWDMTELSLLLIMPGISVSLFVLVGWLDFLLLFCSVFFQHRLQNGWVVFQLFISEKLLSNSCSKETQMNLVPL